MNQLAQNPSSSKSESERVVAESSKKKEVSKPQKASKRVKSLRPDWWYHKGKTDMERTYRKEWEENFSELIPGQWSDGRLIAGHDPENGRFGGYHVAIWQLDQHMHFLRKQFGEECFGGCKICQKSSEKDFEERELWSEIGQPFPGETPSEYPCPEFGCDDIYNYKSQLWHHMEKEHEVEINWDAICNICGFQTKQENVEQAIRRHKIVTHGRPV